MSHFLIKAPAVIDPNAPVEETPGYLGHTFDSISEGFSNFKRELSLIAEFDWEGYENMAVELGVHTRSLTVKLLSGKVKVVSSAGDIGGFLKALPSIDVIEAKGFDQGPASGSGSVFVWSEDHAKQFTLSSQVNALRSALENDYEELRLAFVSDPDIKKAYSDSGKELPVARNYTPQD
jgi:hypothetical protein